MRFFLRKSSQIKILLIENAKATVSITRLRSPLCPRRGYTEQRYQVKRLSSGVKTFKRKGNQLFFSPGENLRIVCATDVGQCATACELVSGYVIVTYLWEGSLAQPVTQQILSGKPWRCQDKTKHSAPVSESNKSSCIICEKYTRSKVTGSSDF